MHRMTVHIPKFFQRVWFTNISDIYNYLARKPLFIRSYNHIDNIITYNVLFKYIIAINFTYGCTCHLDFVMNIDSVIVLRMRIFVCIIKILLHSIPELCTILVSKHKNFKTCNFISFIYLLEGCSVRITRTVACHQCDTSSVLVG